MQSEKHLQREVVATARQGGECAFRLHLREAKRRVERKLCRRKNVCETQVSPSPALTGALTSPASLNEEHFGLILKTWTVCIIKEPENLL